MPIELAKKVPGTIIYNTEFNPYGFCARQARDLYKEAGTLLDYGV
jgi:hypothetical protein